MFLKSYSWKETYHSCRSFNIENEGVNLQHRTSSGPTSKHGHAYIFPITNTGMTADFFPIIVEVPGLVVCLFTKSYSLHK